MASGARIFTKQDFTLGALYRLAARRRMARADVEALLVSRARLKAETAKQLAGHWIGTLPFRAALANAEGSGT